DESGIPGIGMDETDGVTEWAGWAFADKAWWIEAAGDQDRSLFELGSGTVAVADPDEWDDGERLPIPISADPYDTWLTTPEINISASEAGMLQLKFDSSWRPEFDDNYHQTATISASIDGGEPVEVLRWESDEASANFHPYATNETVIVNIDNPEGAKKLVLTFGLFDAGNDWWWAIDNVEVRGVVLDQGPVNPGSNGLVASYALDGDTNDGSGNGLDGTIVGDPAFVEGMIGMALDLNGDDYVDCGTNETLNTLSDAITVSAWVNIRSVTTTWMGIVMKGETAWRLGVNGDTTGIHWGFTGGTRGWQAANSATELPLDEWHHIAGTYDKSVGGIVWIDGVAETENTDPDGVAANDQPLLLGENPEALGRLFDGLLDDVRIYDRMLSEAELRYLAGERATPVDPGSTGLLALWTCDEGEGDVVADVSGNGRDGIFVNGDPAWVEGVSGTAVELVGPTLIEVPPLNVELSEATMAGWIMPNGAQPDWSSIIMTRDPGPATGLNILGFQLAYHWNDTSSSWSFRGGDMIAEDDWTFAAVTIEPDKATFYVNGEAGSVNEVTHDPITFDSNIYLGGDGTAGWVSRRMNGALDDVIMYDRALSAGEIRYLAGIREYTFEGDALDDTWDHDNGSDQWDGTGPGDGNPGGAALLTEDGVTFLRIQDIGDPRDLGISEPSNRKVYLTRLTDISLDGLSLEVRIRVATTAPLDNQVSGDPWPAEGIGYHIRDGGKGMIGVSDGVGIISFSLGQAGEPDYVDAASDLLVMNNLVGAEPSGDVDTGEAAELNAIAVEDASQWNTFVIDIVAGGSGTHVVTISANGGPAESFDVTTGTDLEADAPFIAIGSSGTGGITAFDVDSLSVSN
ncbi:MAG: LamG domain-containing protein, partial [Planctomycetes bacterium]|nr:LamG domain-containing protein [Planctomycetota bacterium]